MNFKQQLLCCEGIYENIDDENLFASCITNTFLRRKPASSKDSHKKGSLCVAAAANTMMKLFSDVVVSSFEGNSSERN